MWGSIWKISLSCMRPASAWLESGCGDGVEVALAHSYGVWLKLCVSSSVYLCAQLCRTLVTPWTVATSLLCPRDFPGKNTRVGCHFLLQGIFPTQESNPHLLGLLHWRQILYHCAIWESLVKVKAAQSCPSLCNSMDYHGVLQVRILERVAFSLLQQIFPTQELNWGLLHCRQVLYQLS